MKLYQLLETALLSTFVVVSLLNHVSAFIWSKPCGEYKCDSVISSCQDGHAFTREEFNQVKLYGTLSWIEVQGDMSYLEGAKQKWTKVYLPRVDRDAFHGCLEEDLPNFPGLKCNGITEDRTVNGHSCWFAPQDCILKSKAHCD